MKNKTVEIKGIVNGQVGIILHKDGCFWKTTYLSKVVRSDPRFELLSSRTVFRTLKGVKDVFKFLSIVYESNKTVSLANYSGRDSARSYAQSRKAFKNKKLAVWTTPNDFNVLSRLKKQLYLAGKIDRATNEQTIRYLIQSF